jgi:arylsulfatase A-like enzyme
MLQPGKNRIAFQASPGEPLQRPIEFQWFKVISKAAVEIAFGEGWSNRDGSRFKELQRTSLPATVELNNTSDKPHHAQLRFFLQETLSIPEVRTMYHKEIAYADQEIQAVLDTLRRHRYLEHSLVILASDHGEGLGDHGLIGHIEQLYDSLLRVPLIISEPGSLPAGQRVQGTAVCLVDVLPTMCELLDVDPPAPIRGRSLVGLVRGGPKASLPIYAMTFRPLAKVNKQGLLLDSYKYIVTGETGEEELYDLGSDQDEMVNLAEQEPLMVEAMRSRLTELQRIDVGAMAVETELTDEEQEQLKILGYVEQSHGGV